MKNFLRIGTGLPVMPLLAAIQREPSLWHADTYLRDYPQGPFGEVDSIILRFPPHGVKESQAIADAELSAPGYDQHECIDTPAYLALPQARKLVMDLMHFVGGTRLGRVIINRIQPGGQIFSHADTPAHCDYWHRHHVVLKSQPGVQFRAGNEQVYMATGECFWFNNGKPDADGNRPEHSVLNNSGDDRIHLVVDIRIA